MDLTDPLQFDRAFRDHSRGVHASAYRVLGDAARAHDVVQDVFLRLWRNPGRFDPARGDLGAYLRLMARSRALDLLREGQALERAGDRLQLVVDRSEAPVEGRPAPAAELRQEATTVRTALTRLPAAQREAVVLAYWGGLTADEVARRARVPLGTAKSRIRLGLARLRDECADALGPDAAGAAALGAAA